MKRNIWIGIGVAVVVALAIVLIVSQTKKEPEVIKIGAILPLTGNAASYGVEEQKGMMIAVSEINEGGGILGKMLEVEYEDSKGNNQEALNALRTIRNSGITIIFTSLTGPSKAVKPLAVKENLLQIIFGMTDDLPQDASSVFRIYPSLSEEGNSFIKYAQLKKPRKVAVLYLDNVAYNFLVSSVLIPGLQQNSINDIITETFSADNLEGIKSAIQKIKNGKPDMLFIAAYYNFMNPILKQIHTQKLFDVTEIVGGLDIPVAVFTVQDFPIELVNNIVCAVPSFMMYLSDSTYATAEAKRFLDQYRAKYNTLPTYDAAYGYDAVMLLAEAIKKSGSTNVEDLSNILKGMTINKASGQIKILSDGNSQSEWLLTKFENGKLVLIE